MGGGGEWVIGDCVARTVGDGDRPRAIEDAVREAGAWGVKATGAGAGGCLLVLGPTERRSDIEGSARGAEGQVLEWSFDFVGVKVRSP